MGEIGAEAPPAPEDLSTQIRRNETPAFTNRRPRGVSHAAIHGALDQVRTALTRLVVELKDSMGDGDDIPDANAANQAVNVVINGQGSSVQITTAQAAGINPTASATGSQTLPALLAQLEDAFRGQGDGETAEKVAHVATLVGEYAP